MAHGKRAEDTDVRSLEQQEDLAMNLLTPLQCVKKVKTRLLILQCKLLFVNLGSCHLFFHPRYISLVEITFHYLVLRWMGDGIRINIAHNKIGMLFIMRGRYGSECITPSLVKLQMK